MVFSEQDINLILQEKQATENELLNLYKTVGSCNRCTSLLKNISTNQTIGRDSTVWYGDVNSHRTNNSTAQQVPTTQGNINFQEAV